MGLCNQFGSSEVKEFIMKLAVQNVELEYAHVAVIFVSLIREKELKAGTSSACHPIELFLAAPTIRDGSIQRANFDQN
jgi:hypothetical protein